MGLYRFHVRDASGLVEDEEGTELPDLHAVLAEALRCTREVMAEAPAVAGMEFVITDEAGRLVLTLPIQHMPGAQPTRAQGQAA